MTYTNYDFTRVDIIEIKTIGKTHPDGNRETRRKKRRDETKQEGE